MEAYLDNAATTRCCGRAQKIVQKTMDLAYGNPSSLHTKGVEAEKYVKDAASAIAKTLKVSDREIYFTSGGTESNNFALIGAAMANRRAGNRLVTTQVEHASVLNTMAYLEGQGFEVLYLPVDRDGVVCLDALRDAVDAQTILVSIMQVNNEIGSIEPVAQAASIVHEKNPKALFHTDAVQAYGKMQIRPKKEGIDLLSASGHKIHGPKGVGFLYVKEKTKLNPIIFGGGQQHGLRSGTQNVPGIAGLGEAALEAYENLEAKTARLYALKEYFCREAGKLDGVFINGKTGRGGAAHIVSLSFRGIRSEVLLHALEADGIYVSAGSACSSNHRRVSPTLRAIRMEEDLRESVLRFSFSTDTKQDEITYTIEKLAEILPGLRRYARR